MPILFTFFLCAGPKTIFFWAPTFKWVSRFYVILKFCFVIIFGHVLGNCSFFVDILWTTDHSSRARDSWPASVSTAIRGRVNDATADSDDDDDDYGDNDCRHYSGISRSGTNHNCNDVHFTSLSLCSSLLLFKHYPFCSTPLWGNGVSSGGSRGGRLGQLPRAPREGGTKEGKAKITQICMTKNVIEFIILNNQMFRINDIDIIQHIQHIQHKYSVALQSHHTLAR